MIVYVEYVTALLMGVLLNVNILGMTAQLYGDSVDMHSTFNVFKLGQIIVPPRNRVVHCVEGLGSINKPIDDVIYTGYWEFVVVKKERNVSIYLCRMTTVVGVASLQDED
eukprot:TRINITY_DN19089_c0_g1_i1.p5 TRINITY_DN19089_c0_g1~~TRINITY_DN19089_c0_g1_i1.p5  ORF type:complete len:110 (-),score=7.98 TRINITY_DN19089_c0_g1_i1:173-502(-)